MGIRDTISRGKKTRTLQKLSKHWLDDDISSIEDVSDDSGLDVQERLANQTSDEYVFPDKQSFDIQGFRVTKLDNSNVLFSLPARFFLRGVAIISLLLVTLTVVTTVLITRSC